MLPNPVLDKTVFDVDITISDINRHVFDKITEKRRQMIRFIDLEETKHLLTANILDFFLRFLNDIGLKTMANCG